MFVESAVRHIARQAAESQVLREPTPTEGGQSNTPEFWVVRRAFEYASSSGRGEAKLGGRGGGEDWFAHMHCHRRIIP